MKTLEPRLAPGTLAGPKPPPLRADPFYLSPPWRRLVSSLVTCRGRCCEQCGRWPSRIFGDHIVELEDGGAALDPANIRLLCGSCHTTKTARARAERRFRRDP